MQPQSISQGLPSSDTHHVLDTLLNVPPIRPMNGAGLRQTSFAGIISTCLPMQRVFATVEKVARTNSTVLVLGESGTGKELIARAVHRLSGRSGRMVPVNCGAIPEDILESELFGHEKGSFTGAIATRIGRFQMAEGGTIFLDEIGEMSPKLQVKLLRVLQERKVEPVGSTRCVDVDVRVIAATNKDLRAEVRAGRFREDLYYRLQVVPIMLAPLRERDDDVMVLARHFMDRTCQGMEKSTLRFSAEAEGTLRKYSWPGNIRELENLIERLAILVEGETVNSRDLPEYMWQGVAPLSAPAMTGSTATSSFMTIEEIPVSGVDFNALVEGFETKLIHLAMARTNGNKKAAAKLLHLNRTTLVEKIKKKGLEVGSDSSSDRESNEGIAYCSDGPEPTSAAFRPLWNSREG